MSRLAAGLGAGLGAMAGGAMGFVGAATIEEVVGTRAPDLENVGGWAGVGALLGAIVGAAIGAGCPTCPTTVKTGVGELPLSDSRFP
jgi:hypothetical protein